MSLSHHNECQDSSQSCPTTRKLVDYTKQRRNDMGCTSFNHGTRIARKCHATMPAKGNGVALSTEHHDETTNVEFLIPVRHFSRRCSASTTWVLLAENVPQQQRHSLSMGRSSHTSGVISAGNNRTIGRRSSCESNMDTSILSNILRDCGPTVEESQKFLWIDQAGWYKSKIQLLGRQGSWFICTLLKVVRLCKDNNTDLI